MIKDIYSPRGAEGQFSFGGIEFVVFGQLKQFFAYGVFDDGANVHVPIITQEQRPYISLGRFDPATLKKLIKKFRLASKTRRSKDFSPERRSAFNRLYLDISLDCNLRCRYCYVDEQRQGLTQFMSIETAKTAIDWLVLQKNLSESLEIRFFGGEPLLNLPLIRNLVSYCKALRNSAGIDFRFYLSTNGTLIDMACARFLAKENFCIKVSLDGPESIHDKNRVYPEGTGSYLDVLKGIKNLMSCELRPTICVTSESLCLSDIQQISQSISELGDLNIQWQTVRGTAQAGDLSPTHPAPNTDYEPMAFSCWEELLCGNNSGLSIFAPGIRKFIDNSTDMRGCGAGLDSIMLSPDGSFHLCQRFLGIQDFIFGNISSGCDIDGLHSQIEKTLDIYRLQCENCWLKYLCSKGCYFTNYLNSGDIGTIDRTDCETIRAYYQAVIWLCYKMALHLPNELFSLLNSSTYLDSGYDRE